MSIGNSVEYSSVLCEFYSTLIVSISWSTGFSDGVEAVSSIETEDLLFPVVSKTVFFP